MVLCNDMLPSESWRNDKCKRGGKKRPPVFFRERTRAKDVIGLYIDEPETSELVVMEGPFYKKSSNVDEMIRGKKGKKNRLA